MSILVVGSSGFLGSRLIAKLAETGVKAIGVSSTDGTGIKPETGILPESFTVPMGTSTVVYMAQSPRYREPGEMSHVIAVNVLSAVRAAVAARSARVKRFVYLSTGTVYAPSFCPLTENAPLLGVDCYSMSKIHGEEALQLFRNDMDVHIVRPFGVYGPGQKGRLVPNIISSIKAGRPITLQARRDQTNDIDGLRISLCYVEDAVNILTHVVTCGGPPCLNLAGEEAPTIRYIATLLGEILQRTPTFMSDEIFRKFDLIADISLLRQSQSIKFSSLRDGLASMAAHG